MSPKYQNVLSHNAVIQLKYNAFKYNERKRKKKKKTTTKKKYMKKKKKIVLQIEKAYTM